MWERIDKTKNRNYHVYKTRLHKVIDNKPKKEAGKNEVGNKEVSFPENNN